MKLPPEIAEAVRPLFESMPIDHAMTALVVGEGVPKDGYRLVESIRANPAVTPPLAAGLWLYVDELDRSHQISQGMKNATGSFWHGIMHRREGDFSNAHYWFRNTGRHPAMADIPDYDPHEFVDAVASRYQDAPEDLIARQRTEWTALFEWCANQGV